MFPGDKESGKTTLIAKLQANEDPKKGAGLEYGYIDVRDEYRDGKTSYRFLENLWFSFFFGLVLYPWRDVDIGCICKID